MLRLMGIEKNSEYRATPIYRGETCCETSDVIRRPSCEV